MNYLPVVIVTIVAVELFLRLPLQAITQQLLKTLQKAIKVVTSRAISDHWKEKVLLRYAAIIAVTTLKIGALLGAVVVTILLLCFILDAVFSLQEPMLKILSSWPGLLAATIVSIAYYQVRSRFAAK